MRSDLTAEIKELQPDVMVECYLEDKYYHYDPTDMLELVDFNADVEHLIESESDNIVTVQHMETDELNAALTLNDNFQELETACPEWQQDAKAIHPKWIEQHQSGHLTVALFVWKKPAKYLIAVAKVTANPE